MNKILKAIYYPDRLCLHLLDNLAFVFPDSLFLRLKFRLRMHRKLNLKNPKAYSDKLQWLKLYYRKSEFTEMVDKVAAKDYVARVIGKEYLIPTLGVYNSVDEIDWDKLPEKFVLKCAHDSGGIIICSDKSKLDIETAKSKLAKGLKSDYYNQFREWPYKDVPRRLICEEYMVDESGFELKDYKFFCFDGEPKALFIASDRQVKGEETKFDFYDIEFNHLPFRNGHPNANHTIAKPTGFDKMVEIARKLSKGLPHARIDLYDVNGKIYFGEITFFHWSGMMPFEPEEWDYKFGEWLTLPKN